MDKRHRADETHTVLLSYAVRINGKECMLSWGRILGIVSRARIIRSLSNQIVKDS